MATTVIKPIVFVILLTIIRKQNVIIIFFKTLF